MTVLCTGACQRLLGETREGAHVRVGASPARSRRLAAALPIDALR